MSAARRLPSGTAAAGGAVVRVLAGEYPELDYAGLTVVELTPGAVHRHDTANVETLVVPLAGSPVVRVDGIDHALDGRPDVWRLTDVLYVPRGAEASVFAPAGCRVALATAPTERVLPVRRLPADEVPVELRGAGVCSREVRNFGVPGVLDADRLIVCEVVTPGGNWSSYPPHRHERDGDDESALEEIYYYEIAAAPGGEPGFALQRVYGATRGTSELLDEVRSGDVVLIPHGYHGPTIAGPGHDLYYLNVMAGPASGARRAWRIVDDPAHAWIRGTWPQQQIDGRLPVERTR